MEIGYVVAPKIMLDEKLPVRFMYREEQTEKDSGWRVFTGFEDHDFVQFSENFVICSVQTILDIDKSIQPYMNAPSGKAFIKVASIWEEVEFPGLLDE